MSSPVITPQAVYVGASVTEGSVVGYIDRKGSSQSTSTKVSVAALGMGSVSTKNCVVLFRIGA